MRMIIIVAALCILAACTGRQHSDQPSPSRPADVFYAAEMSSTQIDALNKENTIILLVGGILEEHGPYLPSFTDGYWNEQFADTLSSIITANTDKQVVIFPTIPLGNSGANDIGYKYSFPGTYTVRAETLRSIFMDLAVEFGEQGFKNIFIIHGHGAPNHQRALDDASDFFNDVYHGRMINLFGYMKFQDEWFATNKSDDEKKEDGIKIHAGLDETSAMLYLKPSLVNKDHKDSKSLPGRDLNELIAIARDATWPGYFGAERLATKAAGELAWRQNVARYSDFVLDIINNKINPDTVLRFGDVLKGSKGDRMLDSLSLAEEQRRKQIQLDWLKRATKNN